MGVDIRLHVEVSNDGKYWMQAGGFRPDPHPDIFGALSRDIVYSDIGNGFEPRGLPEDVSPKTLSDWGIYYEYAHESKTWEQDPFRPKWMSAQAKGAYHADTGTFRASYLSPDEFEEALENAHVLGGTRVDEYEAILVYMRYLERGYQVRVVYFFDS